MSRTYHHGERRSRSRIRKNRDLRRVARSFITLAQVEADAQSKPVRSAPKAPRTNPPTSTSSGPKDTQPSTSRQSGDPA